MPLVGLNASEGEPHALSISPRDEELGVYETRHMQCRTGRSSMAIMLEGIPVANSPVSFRIVPGPPIGLKSRLEFPRLAETPTGGQDAVHQAGQMRTATTRQCHLPRLVREAARAYAPPAPARTVGPPG